MLKMFKSPPPLLKSDIFQQDVHPEGDEEKWRGQFKVQRQSHTRFIIGKMSVKGGKGGLKGCLVATAQPSGLFDVEYHVEQPSRVWNNPTRQPEYVAEGPMAEAEIGWFLRRMEINFSDRIEGIIPGACPWCKWARGYCNNCGAETELEKRSKIHLVDYLHQAGFSTSQVRKSRTLTLAAIVATGADASRTLVISPGKFYFLGHIIECGPKEADNRLDEEILELRPESFGAMEAIVKAFLDGEDLDELLDIEAQVK